ncbi:MAG: TIGR00341 family protein [Alphaproteobacteria bacterium]|nr:TIGR00341 family protein [Alphaproteobacteria bacterium]
MGADRCGELSHRGREAQDGGVGPMACPTAATEHFHTMRLIEVTYPSSRSDEVRAAIMNADPTHFRIADPTSDGNRVAHVFFATNTAQDLVDALQNICERHGAWRIIVLPVEATAPKPEEDKDEQRKQKEGRDSALREEIYSDISAGAKLGVNFFVLTLASTIVAAIGLNSDNVAVVIGAMVIAPLLGPILAVTLGATLGDRKLIVTAGRAALTGLGVGLAASALLGTFMDIDYNSTELMRRTVVGVDSIALALAAGVAAALSVVSGGSTALVGVMVAVALLPPAAASGLFAGAQHWGFSGRALLLLGVNVICIMLASQGVYFWKRVRPRTWLENRSAARARLISFAVLAVFLAAALAIVLLTPINVMPDNPVRN